MEKPYKVDTHPVLRGAWVPEDPHASLVLHASIIEDRFFGFQMSESFPMIHMFVQDPDNPKVILKNLYVLEERPDRDVRARISEYVSLARFLDGFLGAIVAAEVHLLDVTVGDLDVHKEALLLSLYDKEKGLFMLRSTPFHREEDPGDPIRDGKVSCYDTEDLLTRGRLTSNG